MNDTDGFWNYCVLGMTVMACNVLIIFITVRFGHVPATVLDLQWTIVSSLFLGITTFMIAWAWDRS
jgi:hypothetical protein